MNYARLLLILSSITFSLTAQNYQPFTVKDGIIAGYHGVAGAFNLAAMGAAAGDFNNPKAQFYASLSKDCQQSALGWDTKHTVFLNPLLNADLKDCRHVAGLGLVASVATIIFVKSINFGINWIIGSGKNK